MTDPRCAVALPSLAAAVVALDADRETGARGALLEDAPSPALPAPPPSPWTSPRAELLDVHREDLAGGWTT